MKLYQVSNGLFSKIIYVFANNHHEALQIYMEHNSMKDKDLSTYRVSPLVNYDEILKSD